MGAKLIRKPRGNSDASDLDASGVNNAIEGRSLEQAYKRNDVIDKRLIQTVNLATSTTSQMRDYYGEFSSQVGDCDGDDRNYNGDLSSYILDY